jgi:anti-sigma factor RsiW
MTNGLKGQQLSENCRGYAARLNEYIDGRLDRDLTWKIKNHVAVCSFCAETVNSINAVAALLTGATRHEVSPEFSASLEARITALPERALKKRLARFNPLSWLGYFQTPPRLVPAGALAFALLVYFTVNVPNKTPDIVHPVSVARHQLNVDDPSVIHTLVDQHRVQLASDPLADTSAQVLTVSVDSLPPVDQSKNRGLSDADVAVLLDEEI